MTAAKTWIVLACVVATAAAQCSWLGCGDGENEYAKFDSEKRGIIVDVSEPFPSAGNVSVFRFFAGGQDGAQRCAKFKSSTCWVGRDMLVGIFKRVGDGPCGDFEAVRVKKVQGVVDGLNQVVLSTPQAVEKGWFYGFSWLNYGAVSFDYADFAPENLCYCHGNNKGRGSGKLTWEAQTVTLKAVPEDYTTVKPGSYDDRFRPSYRKYAFEVEFCPDEPVDCWLGCGDSTKEYTKFDSEKRGIIVDVSEPFPNAGEVSRFRFYAGGKDAVTRCANFPGDDCFVGRKMLVGIFRPLGDGDCGDFQVVRTKKWTVQAGVNVVDLDTPQAVEAGDVYGFSWTEYGAVSFDFFASDELCYCHGDNKGEGSGLLKWGTESVTLTATDPSEDYSVSYRKYAFEVEFECDEPVCEWVGCGDRETMYEKFDTEKKGIVVDIGHAIPGHGVIDRFEFMSGGLSEGRCNEAFNNDECWVGRLIKIGVFRRSGEGPCGQFELLKMKKWTVELGLNEVVLTNPWTVEAGDFIGFVWGLYGAVSFNFTDITPENMCYCYGANKAEKGGVISDVGDTAMLGASSSDPLDGSFDDKYRTSYRNYAFQAHWCAEESQCEDFGCGTVMEYPKFDSEKRGLVIDMTPLPAGYITGFQFFAGGFDSDRCANFEESCWVDRTLWIGIFRREGDGDGCGEFQLVDRKKWTVVDGVNEVPLSKAKEVMDGDYVGFYWFWYGAVSWEMREVSEENFCYCWGENKAEEGGVLDELNNVAETYQIPALGDDAEADPWGNKYAPSYRQYAFTTHWCETDPTFTP